MPSQTVVLLNLSLFSSRLHWNLGAWHDVFPGELIGAVKQIGGPSGEYPKGNHACKSFSRHGLVGGTFIEIQSPAWSETTCIAKRLQEAPFYPDILRLVG